MNRSIILAAFLAGSFFLVSSAMASKPKPPTQEQHQGQHQDQHQIAKSESVAKSTAVAKAGDAVADSNSGGNTMSINQSYEAGAPDVVLVPNNNTESCLRVFGLSFVNQNGGGGLGIPYRSQKCDFEQAADDAFAQGEREIGWFWKCQNPNLWKQFRKKDSTKEAAMSRCHEKMVGEMSKTATINQLRRQVETLNQERLFERDLAERQREQLTNDCTEAKNRIIEGCYK